MYPAMKQAILLCLCECQGSNPALPFDNVDCTVYCIVFLSPPVPLGR